MTKFVNIRPHTMWSILFILCGLSSTACGDSNRHTEQTEEHIHEGEATNIVSLTSENLKAANIRTGHLEYKELGTTIRANGALRVPNSDKGFVSSLYGGVVQRILAHEGAIVQKGQTIAIITSPQFIQTQEEYLTTISRLTFAEQEVDRQEVLKDSDAGTGKLLQSAKAELGALRSRKASLEQQLQMMGINPSHLSASSLQSGIAVVSPVTGVVGKIKAQIGAYIDPTTPICEVINNKALHLDLHIYEQDLSKLKIGQQIHFRLTNDPAQEYDATIHTIGGTFEPNTRTIAVHCELIGNTSHFIDGMDITGLISLGDVLSPALPNEAIVHDEGKDYVFIRLPHTEKSAEQKHQDDAHQDIRYEFQKVQVLLGATELGYTALTFMEDIPKDAEFVLSGAFFVNATLKPVGEHSH